MEGLRIVVGTGFWGEATRDEEAVLRERLIDALRRVFPRAEVVRGNIYGLQVVGLPLEAQERLEAEATIRDTVERVLEEWARES